MSKPAVVPSRREVWFSDGVSGFYNLRVKDAAWPAAGRRGCLARRSPIGPRNIGRVRIGLTRAQLLRRVPTPRRRTRRSWRWCVKGSKGVVSAAFDRRGRVALVTTTARRPRQPQGPARQHGRAVAALVPAGQVPERHAFPRQPPQPAPVRRAPGQGALHRGHLATDDRAAQDAAGVPAPVRRLRLALVRFVRQARARHEEGAPRARAGGAAAPAGRARHDLLGDAEGGVRAGRWRRSDWR